jgi:polyferredoxin
LTAVITIGFVVVVVFLVLNSRRGLSWLCPFNQLSKFIISSHSVIF